jgi:YVTN family beta-propeller protein
MRFRFLWFPLLALLAVVSIPAVGRLDAPHNWRPSGGPISLTPDGRTLLVANPDSNSVTLVATADHRVIAEVPVGFDPRAVAVRPDGAVAYVANQGSDTISVVDLALAEVVAEIEVGDRPVAVSMAPTGRFAAVALLGEDRVQFVDLRTHRVLAAVPVADRPHGLAFTPDGRSLLVAHLLSGEVTRLPVRPLRVYLPLAIRWLGLSGQVRMPGEVGHVSIPTWPNVAPAPSVIVSADGTRAYLPQTMANARGANLRFDTTVFPKVSVLDLTADRHAAEEHISLPETDQPVGLPWAAALARGDTELWVIHAGSNDLSVIDLTTPERPARRSHLTVGDNPRGVVLAPDGATAYVNNVLAGTVTVVDAQAYTVTGVITTTEIPLPPVLLHGKRLFHASARDDLAKAAWISCNTCHVEGEHDGRTWLLQYLGEVPPGARPVITRNTTSLLGMVETYPLRWSAEWDESADSEFSVRFEQFGTGLIDGEMHPTRGAPNQGRSYDLDCLAAFIDSLVIPEGAPDGACALTPAAERGRALFASAETGCAECHPAPLYTDQQAHDVGTADGDGEWFGPRIDTPTLRFLYDSAPYLHDGSAETLLDVLTTANPNDEHGTTQHLTPAALADLVAFLEALPCEAPHSP